MLSLTVRVCQNLLINSLSLLNIIFSDNLNLLTTSLRIVCVSSCTVIFFENDINRAYFISCFTIVRIMSYTTSVTESFKDDNFIMKFIIINIHSFSDTDSLISSSYLFFQLTLFLLHISHCVTYLTICCCSFRIYHLLYMSFSVLCTLRCSLHLLL